MSQQLGITVSKDEDINEWYTQVVRKAGMADYGPVAGTMIIEPWGMAIWNQIKDTFDAKIKADGVEEAYFPLFIPEEYLEKEAELLEGFLPELAWIEEEGKEDLEDKVAVRPTSESVITPYLAKNIRSYRDLPLRLNQWANVVRWEVTDTRPFLRTREFLWQEGHTAHEDHEGAREEMLTRLEQYRQILEELLAVSVMKGRKPEHDKFPGADVTTTIEALMPDGKSIQSATSHDLGTNFAEAYDITYQDANSEQQHAHTTSWGLSTRVIGALIMAHGDDQGLVLPPEVAPEQVVIVPIWQDDNEQEVLDYADHVADELDEYRVEMDDRPHRGPGYKFNEWELKGVPLRIEIGPNEVEDGTVTIARRDQDGKEEIAVEEVDAYVHEQLTEMQHELLDAQTRFQQDNIHEAHNAEGIKQILRDNGGYVKTPWCGKESCETAIKDDVHAEIVMVPLEQEPVNDKCTICGEDATETAYFAKNY